MDRRIYYAAPTLSSCIAELFGDTGIVEFGDRQVVHAQLTRDIRLLDLCGNGAMRAGTLATIGKESDRSHTQAWSRWFYEQDIYGSVEGLIFSNAHNDEEAVALYERAEDALSCDEEDIFRLDDSLLRTRIYDIMREQNLIF